MTPVNDPDNIRLAMLGMVEGNGHPYSWSAIINGRYDAQRMTDCGYPVIPQYLSAAPSDALGISGARVTHIWCDDPDDADKVARCSYIDHVVDRPEDVIGHVDAVIIPTDIGHEHVQRARPFIETDLPVFIDKPLTDNIDDLYQFVAWHREGKAILSSSCMRYAREFVDLRQQLETIGKLRLITITMMKSWERYGIHALESVYGLLEPGGWQSVTNSGEAGRDLVHAHHQAEVDVLLAVVDDMYGGYGCLNVYGTQGHAAATFSDTFSAFKSQLAAFVSYLKTGQPPLPFDQTIEQMKIIIAALQSRQNHGQPINLASITI